METKFLISFLFILQAIINGVDPAIAQSGVRGRHVCRGGDFKSNIIQKNRASALNKTLVLIKNSSFHGFYHSQAGDKPEEQVSVSFLCPLNIRKNQCECCFNKLLPYLLENCPKQNEGVAWDIYYYLYCMLRYSTGRKIYSVLDDWAWYDWKNILTVKAVELVKTMDDLTSKLKEQAAGGNALRKYAQGTVDYDQDDHSLYVAAQCTTDLSKADCNKCLSKASNRMRSCCTQKASFEGRVHSTNCILWYTHVSFFNPPIVSNPEEYCN
ncbi:putative Gnk2-like domain-containing protein [Helianthus annuus]|nr:putative Gnk2-like domain-containing protein [Helianthus annuus]